MSAHMTLYSSPSSYYSMIARLALLEAGASFSIRRMDIHLAKDQLSPWYLKINPAMTVPSLVDGSDTWTDSRTILEKASSVAGDEWCDTDSSLAPKIKTLVDAHYAISIEHLTFGKAMSRIRPLQIVFPHVLKRIIQKLEASLPTTTDPQAVERKIKLNQQRLAYFTEGDLNQKLDQERESVSHYLSMLPNVTSSCLFGDKISSADIVSTILCARLQMIGEYDLVKSCPTLPGWFEQMQARDAYKKADVWTRFQPWRIVLRY